MLENNKMDSPYTQIIIDFFPELKTILTQLDNIYQGGAYGLALLYYNNFEGNIFYKNEEIKKFALDLIISWCKSKNKNRIKYETIKSSPIFFDLAGISADIADAFLLLKNEFDIKNQKKIILSLAEAGRLLNKYRYDFTSSSNYACATYASYAIYLACDGYNKAYIFKKHAEYRIDRLLLKREKEEGWFPEYSGCDPAYLTFTIEYLAKYYIKAHEADVVEPLKKAIQFLTYFCHPDGSLGGEYGIKNGNIFDPVGFEYCTKFSSYAKFILTNFYKGLQNKKIISPLYINKNHSLFYLNKYLEAMVLHQSINLTLENDFTKYTKQYFPKADIGIRRNTNYYAIVGLAHGAAFKLFYFDKLFLNDLGYYCILKNNELGLTQLYNLEQKNILDGSFFSGSSKELFAKTYFFKTLYLPYFLFSLSNFFILKKIKLLKNLLNYYFNNNILNPISHKQLPLKFERKIIFDWYEIKIIDKIVLRKNIKLKTFGQVKDISEIALPKFTQVNELIKKNPPMLENIVDKLNTQKEIKIIQKLTFPKDDKMPKIEMEIT